jgi:hypothetical protein
MSGSRRDSKDDTRGGQEHGRGHTATDDNKTGGGNGARTGKDSNASPDGGGVSSPGTPGS